MPTRQYYEDRLSGKIYSLAELARLVEEHEVPRLQLPRRFRALPETSCRLLYEAELIATLADGDRDQPSA